MSGIPDRRSPCRIDQGKGKKRHHCSTGHAELVRAFRDEQHAQQLRAEAATHGYAPELAAYFGDDGTGDAVEKRLTFKDWLTGHADNTRSHWREAA